MTKHSDTNAKEQYKSLAKFLNDNKVIANWHAEYLFLGDDQHYSQMVRMTEDNTWEFVDWNHREG